MFLGKFLRRVLPVAITAVLLLTACNIGGATPAPTQDINALSTALVATTVARLSGQLTETALAVPATNTPLPTNTAQPLPTLDLSSPTTDSASVASPTLNPSALPTFSFASTPVTGFTQLAPSATPAAGAPGALGDACDNSVFEGDITIPDGTVLKPGEDFQKIWAIRNTGSCTWDDGYTLVYIGGTKPDLDPVNFDFKRSSDFVVGGAGVNIAINLTAPLTPGKYNGTWRMRNDRGFYFGTFLSVYIEVKGTSTSYP